MKTLHLTTPDMTGPDVKAAQTLLAKNKFGSFYAGPIDGDFGPETAHAAYLAKYWIGYSVASCKPFYGDLLHNYLSGTKPLGTLMKARRALRLKHKHTPTLGEKAYNSAITQLGITESPAGSNLQKYGAWYGANGEPWCAMFVSWNYVNAGSKSFKAGSYYAYVPYIVDDARAGRNGLAVTSKPVKGDVVCYDWNGDGIADHTGLFEAWVNEAAGTFTAIEGNTSGSNNSNGGEVMRQNRTRNEVICFAHVER